MIPHEVVKMNVIEGVPMVKAWRVYLKLTQAEVAKRAGITQATLAHIQNSEGTSHKGTCQQCLNAR